MKTLISLFLISFVAFCTISCNDDDKDTPDLANRYGAYEKPHFAFEYASDTIRIGMKPYYEKKIAVTEFKAMFNAMATEKMGAYFKGIQFKENKQLIISARMKEGDVYNLPGTYELSGNYLQITLDKEVMAHLMGDKAANIPAISFKYDIRGKQMTMYFDKVYLQVIYFMMENQIAAMIVDMMEIDFSQMPEGMEAMIMKEVKNQLGEILTQIRKIEIGFVLMLDELDYA